MSGAINMDSEDAAAVQREATATIRGYVYQFQASILAVLAAGDGEKVTVEGVEDFDVSTLTTDTYSQVKYYEAQKLTDATLRDAILPMLKGFLRYTPEVRSRKRYVLYGHFKETETVPAVALDDLKRILVQRFYPKDKDSGEKKKIEVNLQDELKASDPDLSDFGARLEIKLAEPIEQHRGRVIKELALILKVQPVEAEGYCYPTALTAMSELSMERTNAARTTTRAEFLKSVKPNVAIYAAWSLREDTETVFCRKMRDRYFSTLNIESKARFFILTLAAADGVDEAWDLVSHIIEKWSSHKIKRKPDRERYAPFFFFPEMNAADLVALKGRLFNEGRVIIDGHPFDGAPFSTHHLLTSQTRDRPISARFIATKEQLAQTLDAVNQRKLVIQLHTRVALALDPGIPQIAIPIDSANMARKIL